jgi:GTP pyrophosphokinase
VDFAYKVHTEVGHHCAGARVNGRLVPLRTGLVNGDMVEVLTNASRNPSRDWLSFVATTRAKQKIRQWLNTEQKKRATEIGRRLFDKEARRYGASVRKLLDSSALATLMSDDGIAGTEELMSRIGFGKVEARKVLERVLPAEQMAEPAEAKPSGKLREAVHRMLPFKGDAGPIVVKGQDDLLAYLAKCCSPLPGEEIVGYVTRGRGVSVHSVDCPNVQNLLYHPEREIAVEWGRPRERQDTYRIALMVETEDRPGILARLADAIASQESNISQMDAETPGNGRGLIGVTVQVRDRKHLEKILTRLRGLPGVLRVDRRMSGAPHGGTELA